jgi:hypothetical protein
LLLEDFDAFNDKLLDYLIWFNESRPHYALGLRSPMQFLAEEHLCNMYWQDTQCIGGIHKIDSNGYDDHNVPSIEASEVMKKFASPSLHFDAAHCNPCRRGLIGTGKSFRFDRLK